MEWFFACIGVAFSFISGFGFGYSCKAKTMVMELRKRGWKIEPPDIEKEVKK